STRSCFTSGIFHEPQKPDAHKFGMHGYHARRTHCLQSATLFSVFADCDHRDLAGLVGGHIRHGERSEFAKTGTCEQPEQGEPECSFATSSGGASALG